jgi:WD40 repeat protein
LWDLAAQNGADVFDDLSHPNEAILAVAFSPDDRRLATAGGSGLAWVWDLTARNSVMLPGHIGDIATVAFSPDGRWLAAAGADNTARLWDLTASNPAAAFVVLAGHKSPIYRSAFSPDGRWLATSSADGTVRLWLLNLAELMELAALVGRNLTCREWQSYFKGQVHRRTFPKLPVPPDPPWPRARFATGP